MVVPEIRDLYSTGWLVQDMLYDLDENIVVQSMVGQRPVITIVDWKPGKGLELFLSFS